MDIVQFLSAFGLGAIVTAVVQAWLSQRADKAKRDFQEKKEAYIGILDAFRLVLVEHSQETAKNVGYWQMRCNLVGSKEVCELLEEVLEADQALQREKIKKLQMAMRKDLSIQAK